RRRQERLPSLGFPIAAALAGRRLAPPGSAAAIAGEAAGPVGALLAVLDGGGHAAVAIDAAGELDARRTVIIDVAMVDLEGVAVGAVALARLGDDQNAPCSVESRLCARGDRRHAAERCRDGQKEV